MICSERPHYTPVSSINESAPSMSAILEASKIRRQKFEATQAIQCLIQRTSASQYVTVFQRYAQLVQWGDAALMYFF